MNRWSHASHRITLCAARIGKTVIYRESLSNGPGTAPTAAIRPRSQVRRHNTAAMKALRLSIAEVVAAQIAD